jgi:hypothetical protein
MWALNNSTDVWQKWIWSDHELQLPPHIDFHPWQEELTSCQIKIKEGLNILKWGYPSVGTFTLKEAYHLHANHHNLP